MVQTQVQLQLPSIPVVGGRRTRGTIEVLPRGKAPRRQFEPGSFVRLDRQLYEIMYAYRLVDPRIWLYGCEYRDSLEPESDDLLDIYEELGGSNDTPLVVYEIFRTHAQVMDYFEAIPRVGDRTVFNTQELLTAELVSSGAVLPPKNNPSA